MARQIQITTPYHVITSSTTDKTLEMLGCKKAVDKNFCSLCHPEIQSEPILRFPYYYEGGEFKRTLCSSYTYIWIPDPRRYSPESAWVYGSTWRKTHPDSNYIILYGEEKGAYLADVKVKWTFWHPAEKRYYIWRQMGKHKVTYLDSAGNRYSRVDYHRWYIVLWW